MLAQNPGGVLFWLTDDEGNLRAHVRKNDEETRIFEIFNSPENSWKALMPLDLEDSLTVLGFTAEGDVVWEFAGKMHTDLMDGVNWALAQGIADPQRIAIFGFSYGGYATLVGLTITPEIFACGVDVFGISNSVTFTQSVPQYWKNWMPLWYKYVGNPDDPEDRRRMKAQSPFFRVDQIHRPCLIVQGANDVRVKQQESDQIVDVMRKAGKDVEYILFKDEGHSIRNWQNRIIFYRKLEDFLAGHLGGRSAGFDLDEFATNSK